MTVPAEDAYPDAQVQDVLGARQAGCDVRFRDVVPKPAGRADAPRVRARIMCSIFGGIIKFRRLRCLGYTKRMKESREHRILIDCKPAGRRRAGRMDERCCCGPGSD